MTPRTRKPVAYSTFGSGGIAYLMVSVLICAAAVYTQANLLFWAFGLLVGGLCMSIVLSAMMMRQVRVERLLPSHGVAGEVLVLRYRITNAKRWIPAFGIVIHETWGQGRSGWKKAGPVAESPQRLRGRPFGWVLHVGPGQTVLAEALCWPMRRGDLRFERLIVATSFPFGVVRRVLVFEQPATVLVYPTLYRLNRRMLARMSESDPRGHQQMDRGGNDEFFGLREYRTGDSVRTIHWKHSAKRGELIAREMTQPAPPQVMLALDLTQTPPPAAAAGNGSGRKGRADKAEPGREHADAIERAISLAASVVCDAHLNGYQIGLAVLGAPAPPFPVHHSLPHRTRMLEALARLDVSKRRERPGPIPAHPSVVVVPYGQDDAPPRGRAMILYAQSLERYIAPERGRVDLLTERTVMRSRRMQLQEARR